MTKVLHTRCPCKFMQGVPEIYFEKLAPMQLSTSHLGLLTIHTLGMCIVNTPRCSVNNLYLYIYNIYSWTTAFCGLWLIHVHTHPGLLHQIDTGVQNNYPCSV